MLVDEAGVPGLIDWGDVQWGPRVAHVANQLLRLGCDGVGDDVTVRLLQAYQRHASLTRKDLEALGTMRRYCLAVYAKFAAGQLNGPSRRTPEQIFAYLRSVEGELRAEPPPTPSELLN